MSQAKTLNDTELRAVLAAATETRYPERNRVIVLLSFKAGLRASEIAKLRRWHVMTPGGELDNMIRLDKTIIKGGMKKRRAGKPRTVPINADLRTAILDYWRVCPGDHTTPLVLSERADTNATEPTTGEGPSAAATLPSPMLPRTIVRLFSQLYRRAGLIGARSHSGRRTFGTKAARAITKAGGSLRDVQQLLGHADLATTQRYIEGDEEAKKRVVELI
jgi:integrase/recombinase XerD